MGLNWCCCCVPLRNGALTIGILYLIVNVGVLLGWAGWLFALLAEHMEGPHKNAYIALKFTGFVCGMLAILCGINITMDSLLVHGVRRNRRKFMLPWVVWYGIFNSLVTLTLLGVELWLLVMYIEEAKHPTESTGILIAFLIMIGCVAALSLPVMWYWYVCVVSYYNLLAPSDVYVMEALREQVDTEGAPLAHRPVKKISAK